MRLDLSNRPEANSTSLSRTRLIKPVLVAFGASRVGSVISTQLFAPSGLRARDLSTMGVGNRSALSTVLPSGAVRKNSVAVIGIRVFSKSTDAKPFARMTKLPEILNLVRLLQ